MEDKDINPDHESGLLADGETTIPALSADQVGMVCPQCGSTRVRKPTRPLLLNIVAIGIFTPLMVVVCSAVLGLLLSLLVFPVTTCIAIVGRRRCLNCGHRFEPVWARNNAGALTRFPWFLHTLNIFLLFLLCIIGPYFMRIRSGAGTLPDMMANAGVFITLGLLLWGSLAYHLLLYRTLRRRVTNPLIWVVLFVLPGMVGGAKVFHDSSPKVRARALLAYAKLAPMPESAKGIRFYTWSTPFSGEDFLRFTADPNDVERFLASSTALQGQEPERFSAQRMRLEYPKDYWSNPDYMEDGNIYYTPDPTVPRWYKREIRGPARRYFVQPPRYQFPGEVLVDDETNTVYIHLCFS